MRWRALLAVGTWFAMLTYTDGSTFVPRTASVVDHTKGPIVVVVPLEWVVALASATKSSLLAGIARSSLPSQMMQRA